MKEKLDKSKENVSAMFNSIAHKYDFLNHFLSLGIDNRWRKKLRKQLPKNNKLKILDIATGTGDLAVEMAKLNPNKITGVDISPEMVKFGIKKIIKKKLDKIIELKVGDSLQLEFQDNSFDVVTCAFGVRNFENLEKGLKEIHRVLNKNGQILILEFSKPSNKFFGGIYKLYFLKILPMIGRLISKDNFAYKYLPISVNTFPYGKDFCNILKKTGFKETKTKEVTMGLASIYTGIKN